MYVHFLMHTLALQEKIHFKNSKQVQYSIGPAKVGWQVGRQPDNFGNKGLVNPFLTISIALLIM